MSETRFCSACGHPNGVDARFCGKCGQPIVAAPAPRPAPSVAAANKTLAAASIDPAELMAHVAKIQEQQRAAALGPPPAVPTGGTPPAVTPVGTPPAVTPPSAPAAPAAPTAAALAATPAAAPAPQTAPTAPFADATQLDGPRPPRPAAGQLKTMMGMSLAELAPPARAPVPERPRAAMLEAMLGANGAGPGPAPSEASPAKRPPARTMLGMFAAPDAGGEALPAAPSGAASSGLGPHAGPGAPPVAATVAEAPMGSGAAGQAPASRLQPTAPPAGPNVHPSVGPSPVVPAPSSPPRKQLGPSHRTMLGVSAPPDVLAKAQAALDGRTDAPAIPPPAVPNLPTGDVSIAGLPSPRRRTNALLVAVVVLGALMVVGGVAAFFLFGRPTGREVTVSVNRTEGGEVLHVAVPGLPEGARARFGGEETPFSAGAADLRIAADALHVGDNPLAIELVLPDGTVERQEVTLTVSYRVRVDLASLRATPAAIDVVVDALAGSTVVLDGQPLTLDAAGHAARAYPVEALSPGPDGAIVHTASYTITPPAGEAATGTLTTRVPVITLHIERPGDGALTDRSEVELAGTVTEGAGLTVDGAAVTVLPGGRFLHRLPLPAVGERSLRIVASGPDRAPAARTLRVRRVESVAREAEGFSYDRSLTYARLAEAPTTRTGQRIMYEGRVYNVDVHDGRGVLQMLVRECPSGERCPLWVSYATVTEIAVDSWVRVYGTVEGEQQFRSTSGEVRTVPSVAAAFVLPARP